MKRGLAMFLCCAIILCFNNMTALAQGSKEVIQKERVQPRSEACGYCPNGSLIPGTRYEWYETTHEKCTHFQNATWDDTVIIIHSTQEYNCDQCGYHYTAVGAIRIVDCKK